MGNENKLKVKRKVEFQLVLSFDVYADSEEELPAEVDSVLHDYIHFDTNVFGVSDATVVSSYNSETKEFSDYEVEAMNDTLHRK